MQSACLIRPVRFLFSLGLLFGAVSVFGAELSSPAPPPAPVRPAGLTGTVIVPDTFLRRWDPVTFFFPEDTGRAAGPEDHPEEWVTFAPSHPGAWNWLDRRTLQFRPATPWPPLARFSITARQTSLTLVTLMVPPSSTFPEDGATGLDPVEAITLTFPEPLDPGALAGMTSLELRPLPGVDGATARWLTARDFDVKTLERTAPNAPASYVLQLRQPVPLETRAILHLRLALDDQSTASFARVAFSTAEPFRVAAFGTRRQRLPLNPKGTRYTREQALDGGGGRREVVLEFNAPPRALGSVEGRNLVRFTPAVENLSFQLEGSWLTIGGDFIPDTIYKATLVPGPLTDRRGRPLSMSGTSEIHFFFPPRPPFLRWGAAQGIAERFGPQRAPVQGRAEDRVDLRIHKIDPLDRRFWPFGRMVLSADQDGFGSEPGGWPRGERPPVVNENDRPPGPGEEPGFFDDTGGPIPREEIGRRIAALGAPAFSKLVGLPLTKTGPAADFGLDLEPHLSFISGKNAPGTYLVGLRELGPSGNREWMRVQVTDLVLTTLEEPRKVVFAVTSLSTGRPVPGAELTVEGVVAAGTLSRDELSGDDALVRWETLVTGSTDGEGLFHWELPGAAPQQPPILRRIVVKNGDDVLVLDPANPPEAFADNRWFPSRWLFHRGSPQGNWLQWTGENLEERGPRPELLCHIFSERPVYRPEETVHLKGYLRQRERGSLRVVPLTAFLVVLGPGELKWRYPVTLNEYGSFYYAFAEEKLPTGDYSAHLENREGVSFGGVRFKLDAYRIPQFELQLHTADQVPLDREFEVEATAAFYAGGRVAQRPIAWRVTQFPYAYRPAAREGFVFSSDSRFSPAARFQSTPRLERVDTTDDEGSALLTLNPTIEPTAQPRTYVVEATVTGADDQTVTAVRSVIALPPFVLGLKVPRFLERAEAIEPEIVAIGPDDHPLSGLPITVRLIRRQWHSVLRASDFTSGEARFQTDIVDEKIFETLVTSGSEAVKPRLSIREAGVYLVELEARDRLGRAQVVSVDLYAGGGEPVAWSKPATRVFAVTADQDAYDPGETAALVLESPFQKASVLAVVEAPEGNEYRWLSVDNGAATFLLPIRGTFTPRVPVHFVLIRGRVPGSEPLPGSATDLGKPATYAATAWVKVNPLDNRVEVALEHPEKARPGETIEITVRLKDPQGKPLAGEATLWLVDAAVLALGKEQRLDPVPDFLSEVFSHLEIRDTRNLAFGWLPFAERPGGGAGGEGGIIDRSSLRKNFKTVPYYNPSIPVGPDGVAKVKVQLSDDLTLFRVRAKAVAGADRFGFATGTIAVRLPLIVQPALPRFLRPGDRFAAAAIGRVVEGPAGPGAAEMRASGVTVEGPTRLTLDWAPNRPERIAFTVAVPSPAEDLSGPPSPRTAVFRFGVSRASDGATDAFEVALPIRDDRPRIASRKVFDLEPGKTVALPPVEGSARPGTIRRSVLLSGQPGLVRMAAGLDYLLSYPHGCTEQRLSRARAALATKSFRSLLKREIPDRDLDRMVNEALNSIANAVDASGLVAYWPGGTGTVSLTAWAVQFLVEARTAGYPLDARLLDTLARSLQQALRSDYPRFLSGEAWSERTWALAALAAAGKFDPAYGAELARRAQYLDLEGAAEVAVAFVRGGQASSPALPDLIKKLNEGIVTRLHQGQEIYGGLQGVRTASGLVLPSETRSIAGVARAFAAVPGGHSRLPLLTRALVDLGRGDGWGSTNANASALLALSEQLKPPFRGTPAARLSVRFDREEGTLSVGPDRPTDGLVSGSAAPGEAVLQPGAGGAVALLAETSYLPAGDGSTLDPRSNGFVVTREVLRIGKNSTPPEREPFDQPGKLLTLRVGDVLEEHLQVVNPENRHFVAIVVPLAGGLEVLNPRLATAPPEAKPAGALTLAPTYSAFLDDQVAFYFDTLPKGTYDFFFRTRATVAGTFVQPPGRAEMMYDLAVAGNSPGARVEVTRPAD